MTPFYNLDVLGVRIYSTHNSQATTLQVLTNDMWLVATVLDTVDTEHFHHHGKFCWTRLDRVPAYIWVHSKLEYFLCFHDACSGCVYLGWQ